MGVLTGDYNNTVSLMEALCNTSNVVLIYAVTPSLFTHTVSTVAAFRGIPVFLYDTDLLSQYNTVSMYCKSCYTLS